MSKNNYHKVVNTHNRKLQIIAKSLLVGISAGLVTVLYRICLTYAGEFSLKMYSFAGRNPLLIGPLFLVLAFLGWIVGQLVTKYPLISGSGIPQVKGQLMGYFKNPWLSTLLAKFAGGIIAIFAGLSVGREGPSIQLGAATAHGVGNKIASTRTEKKILISSGASAGLSAAFNAPLAGVMFALEEIFKYFSPIVLLATIVSAVAADLVSSFFFGLTPIFHFDLDNTFTLDNYWIILVLGVVVGTAGAFYNFVIIKSLKLYKRIAEYNTNLKFILPFLAAGVFGLFFPIVLGGGDHIIEELGPASSLQWLFLVLVVKFIFSMVSFGSGAPGGIFFPLLVMGSLLGGIVGNVAISGAGVDPQLFFNFVALAMAGFFTAIVRAPITGIILLIEMTGSFSHLLPLTVVSITAYVTADLLKSTPIYESLLELQLEAKQAEASERDSYKMITFESIVHFGAAIEGKKVRELEMPFGTLIIAIRREGIDITPHGDTEIRAEDYLVVLTNVKDEPRVREMMAELTES